MSDVITTLLECSAVLGYIWLYATKREKLLAWEEKHIFNPMCRLRYLLRRFIRKCMKKSTRFMAWLNKPEKHGIPDDEWRIGQIKVFGDEWR